MEKHQKKEIRSDIEKLWEEKSQLEQEIKGIQAKMHTGRIYGDEAIRIATRRVRIKTIGKVINKKEQLLKRLQKATQRPLFQNWNYNQVY